MGWWGQAVSELTHVQALTHPGMVPALLRAPEQSRKSWFALYTLDFSSEGRSAVQMAFCLLYQKKKIQSTSGPNTPRILLQFIFQFGLFQFPKLYSAP